MGRQNVHIHLRWATVIPTLRTTALKYISTINAEGKKWGPLRSGMKVFYKKQDKSKIGRREEGVLKGHTNAIKKTKMCCFNNYCQMFCIFFLFLCHDGRDKVSQRTFKPVFDRKKHE